MLARDDKKALKNHALFNSVIRGVSKFFEGEDFTQDELNESYVKLVIKNVYCDYNPYETPEYYDKPIRDDGTKNQNQMFEFDDSIRSDLPLVDENESVEAKKDEL